MAKTIRQTTTINAPPHEVYEALLDSKKHAAFTGGTAKISRRVGGRFSVFDRWATGKILELQKDAKIVQTWRTEDFEEDDPDSRVTFTIHRAERGSRLTMVHANVPDREYEALKQGWIDFYWTPMKAYLEK